MKVITMIQKDHHLTQGILVLVPFYVSAEFCSVRNTFFQSTVYSSKYLIRFFQFAAVLRPSF